MQNPWLALPSEPPFVAPADAESLARLRRLADDRFALKLDLPPQPWTGNPHTAEVFMLALNPGFSPDDYVEFRNADYAQQWRLALSFQTRTPFYFLDPAFQHTGGYRWWARRLREVIAEVGQERVEQRVMCLEHFPYKSASYKPLGIILPSQQYTFGLLREAMNRGKQIVVMRSERVTDQSGDRGDRCFRAHRPL